MTTSQEEHVFQLFDAAAELLPEAREAFLERECAGESAVRAEVVRLLKHEGLAEQVRFLALDGLAAADVLPDLPHAAGTTIAGRYHLLERLGQGGMGSVWKAEQREPVKRQVAVKFIRAGMDSQQVFVRFEAERQASALMEHPNIARVFDGGTTESGHPFLVMELVHGLPLTEYCDQHRLTIARRLELFVQVCAAVQHAHQKAILHRDLKPSNVLVTEHDGKPVPKVIDFGLAKALNPGGLLTEQTLHTGYGMVLGTPLYMAPEQVAANAHDVDTRADIYALGVILYELLTGTTPVEKKRFKEASWDELQRLIREEEPPRPSARLSSSDALPGLATNRQIEPKRLTKLVRGELDWIVMKAMEKERNRRYDSPTALADDVRRYLTDQPVAAGPPNRWYRARKFIRRNRRRVTVTVMLLVFGGMALASLLHMRQVRQDASRETKEAHQYSANLGLIDFIRISKKANKNLTPRMKSAALSGKFTPYVRSYIWFLLIRIKSNERMVCTESQLVSDRQSA